MLRALYLAFALCLACTPSADKAPENMDDAPPAMVDGSLAEDADRTLWPKDSGASLDAMSPSDDGHGGDGDVDATLALDAGFAPDAVVMRDSAVMPDANPALDAAQASMGAIVADPGAELALLFVGNSYTNANRLDRVVCDLAEQTGRFESVQCEKVTAGGYRLIQHAADAASGQRLGQLLDPQNPMRPAWDAVVLQEQSQIPGFPENHEALLGFRQGVVDLDARIAAVGAETALFMTWGRRDGDAHNQGLYPDFLTMQRRLQAGYTTAAAAATTPERRVHVIPVGLGWQRTYERDAESDFRALYSGDGSHPARPGTYLSALIILNHLIGLDLDRVADPENGPAPALAGRLREDAHEVARE